MKKGMSQPVGAELLGSPLADEVENEYEREVSMPIICMLIHGRKLPCQDCASLYLPDTTLPSIIHPLFGMSEP